MSNDITLSMDQLQDMLNKAAEAAVAKVESEAGKAEAEAEAVDVDALDIVLAQYGNDLNKIRMAATRKGVPHGRDGYNCKTYRDYAEAIVKHSGATYKANKAAEAEAEAEAYDPDDPHAAYKAGKAGKAGNKARTADDLQYSRFSPLIVDREYVDVVAQKSSLAEVDQKLVKALADFVILDGKAIRRMREHSKRHHGKKAIFAVAGKAKKVQALLIRDSTKAVLMDAIELLRDRDCIVAVQYGASLNWLKKRLRDLGYNYDGSGQYVTYWRKGRETVALYACSAKAAKKAAEDGVTRPLYGCYLEIVR